MKKSDLIEVYVYFPNYKYSAGVLMRETEFSKEEGDHIEFDFAEKIHILKDDWEELKSALI